jgi:hypothetical protein
LPLSPQARTGLFAVGVVAGAFLLCGGGVLAVALIGRDGTTGAGRTDGGRADGGKAEGEAPGKAKGLADRPVSEGRKDDDESYVMGHRWWARPLGRADLDRIVRAAVETSAREDLFVERDGTTRTELVLAEYPELAKTIKLFRPRGKRPDRADVVRSLRAALDRVEFRDGPGR